MKFWTKLIFTILISLSWLSLVIIFTREIMSGHEGVLNKNMKSRTKALNEKCKYVGTNDLKDDYTSTFRNIVVNDRYKILFCYVPKVACTNFLRLMLWLMDRKLMAHSWAMTSPYVHILKKNLTRLGSFSPSGVKYRINNYRKAMFVRDPLVRLISAFRNKFESKNPYYMSRYGKQIIQRYRNNSLYISKEKDNIKFSEFLQYLTDEKTIRKGYDNHWMSFDDLCHPCVIRYNFIGKYESFDKDVENLLNLLDIHDQFKFPRRDEHYKHAGSAEFLSSSFQSIEPAIFEKIVNIYAKDYALFNYKIPSLSDVKDKIM